MSRGAEFNISNQHYRDNQSEFVYEIKLIDY